MPMHRANKSKRGSIPNEFEMSWFRGQRRRQRVRNKIAKLSRIANRPK